MTRMLTIALLTQGDPGQPTGGYLYQQRMAQLAPQYQARIDFVSFPNFSFPLPAVYAPAVLRRAQRRKAQALVLDSIAAAFLGPWLALRRIDLPLVAMLHQSPGGIDHGPLRTVLQMRLDLLAYRRACRLLVSSDWLADQLTAQGFSRQRIVVVPPGWDNATPPSAARYDLRLGRQAAFLCVANWQKRKGILSLLDAFARLPPRAGTLHLVGDDRPDPRYRRRVRVRLAHPDLKNRVVVHGLASPERVSALYVAADVFVLPSFDEPYGMVYGEAMAAGLPVVGWQSGNLPYLVDDGQEGVLVAPGDVDGLTRALERLANDESWRLQLGQAAVRRARTRPTWQDSVAAFFGAIREVVENTERL